MNTIYLVVSMRLKLDVSVKTLPLTLDLRKCVRKDGEPSTSAFTDEELNKKELQYEQDVSTSRVRNK
jgi:hypothetical protein